ncbi:MAG: hypothetical protein H8E66_19515 [Planctomycetes bacterium]|nr:hypothetical protein [Planctomycetota bacterium]
MNPITLSPGESVDVGVKIERHDFPGSISLSIDGLPDNVVSNSIVISEGQSDGTLTLSTDEEVPAGHTDVIVVASAGNWQETISLRLLVTSASQSPLPDTSPSNDGPTIDELLLLEEAVAKWNPTSDDQVALGSTLADRRSETLFGLDETQLSSLLSRWHAATEKLGSSVSNAPPGSAPFGGFGPGGPQFGPPGNSEFGPPGFGPPGVPPFGQPGSSSAPGQAEGISARGIPEVSDQDRLLLVGQLHGVRVFDNKTWVYLWQVDQPKGNLPGAPPTYIAIQFDDRRVAEWMADYKVGEIVRVAATCTNWQNPRMPSVAAPKYMTSMRAFEDANGKKRLYWCFQGEGIEKHSAPKDTWIDARLGRLVQLDNSAELRRSPGHIYRNLPAHRGTSGRITANFDSVQDRDGRILVFLTLQESSEGPLTLVVDMGKAVTINQFVGYNRGVTVEADVTLADFSITSVVYPKTAGARSTLTEESSIPASEYAFQLPKAEKDPLAAWNCLPFHGRAMRLLNDPASQIQVGNNQPESPLP